MSYQQDRDEFMAVVIREKPSEMTDYEALDLARKILRHANTHARLQAEACSIAMTERQEVRHQQSELRAENNIRRHAATLGFDVAFQGDPRGFTVKLTLPSGRSNSWGQDGWGVPTRNY